MVDQPAEINSVDRIEFDATDPVYIAFLTITQEGETFDATHAFRTTEDSAWAPWLLQEIDAGNISVTPYVRVVAAFEVNAERDRRKFSDITFDLNGSDQVFQADAVSQKAIHEAATRANTAMSAGAGNPDDYAWNSDIANFQWILANNSRVSMDAPEIVALWEAVSKRNHDLQHAARDLKDMNPIPLTFEDDSFWT